MPKSFRLALIQLAVAGGARAANLDRAVAKLAEAAAGGAQVALLPECCDLGWTHPSALTEATAIPDGVTCQRLAEAARVHGLYLCAGLTEKDGDRVYNAAVLLDPEGRLLLRHRKLNELDIGHPYYAQGDRLNVAETPFGTIGVMICADAFAADDVLTRSLGYMGADCILSPCAWAVPPEFDNTATPYGALWRESYGRVARAFSMPMIGVSNVGHLTAGPWAGWDCIGCSLAVGADGDVLLQAPFGVDAECVLFLDLEPVARPARGTRWSSHWKAASSEE